MFQLYRHLDISLRRSDFSYSFSRLERLTRLHSRTSTPPPPPYDASANAREESPPVLDRPKQSTEFIYEGSNGLVFPPLALPSEIASTSLFDRARYCVHLILLSLSYLHLLLLAFVYVNAGLTRHPKRASGFSRQRRRSRVELWTTRLAKWLALTNVSNEPVESWSNRHWIWVPLQEEILVPLYAAVSTVGRHQAKRMPVGECLGGI